MTDTAAHADVVFPATTQLEHLDVLWSWGHHYLTLNEPAIAPLGEARSEQRDLPPAGARRLGLDDPVLRGDGRGDAGDAARGRPGGHQPGRGCARAATPRSTSARGRLPHAEGGFATPSGKLELRCDAAARTQASTRCRSTTRPARSPTRSSRSAIPLALLTPKTHLFLNSTFANGRRQHAAQPEPFVVIHPADAAPRGIADGATVRVANDRGSFPCRAVVSDDARAGRPRRADGLVEPRLRRRPQPAGHDAAAADDAARRADVQRQPRGDRARMTCTIGV